MGKKLPFVLNPMCLAHDPWPWGLKLGKQKAHFQVELLLLELFSNSLWTINYLYQIPGSHLSPWSRWSLIWAGLRRYLYIKARAREKLGRKESIAIIGLCSSAREGGRCWWKLHLFFGKLLKFNLCHTWEPGQDSSAYKSAPNPVGMAGRALHPTKYPSGIKHRTTTNLFPPQLLGFPTGRTTLSLKLTTCVREKSPMRIWLFKGKQPPVIQDKSGMRSHT